jgi:hypothetical protein
MTALTDPAPPSGPKSASARVKGPRRPPRLRRPKRRRRGRASAGGPETMTAGRQSCLLEWLSSKVQPQTNKRQPQAEQDQVNRRPLYWAFYASRDSTDSADRGRTTTRRSGVCSTSTVSVDTEYRPLVTKATPLSVLTSRTLEKTAKTSSGPLGPDLPDATTVDDPSDSCRIEMIPLSEIESLVLESGISFPLYSPVHLAADAM